MTLPLVLISAWNDSGGGFLHRLFDGHPQVRCYPFELQVGAGAMTDGLSDWFADKYRWPVIAPDQSPEQLFDAIINEELRDAMGGGPTAKFKDFPVDIDLPEWRARFAARVGLPLMPAPAVHAYLDTFFECWRDRRVSQDERVILGHCPVLVLDWDRIRSDDPTARMVNVVRSPFAGFADMRRRHPRLDPEIYGRKWALVNTLAYAAAAKEPDRFRIIRFDDLLAKRATAMSELAGWLGLRDDEALTRPSWNGRPLVSPGPFGGVPEISEDHERANLTALGRKTIDAIATVTAGARALFGLPVPETSSQG